MAAGATYEPITTQTLGSAATITFNSIASTWTDLKIVAVMQEDLYNQEFCIKFNNDTTSTYSWTQLKGDGSTASSSRNTNDSNGIRAINTSNAQWGLAEVNIFSYAGSTYKTVLTKGSSDQNGSGQTRVTVGLWRSTAAITSIQLDSIGLAFKAGSTFTLYGIKAA
jgi:hypothetical protein